MPAYALVSTLEPSNCLIPASVDEPMSKNAKNLERSFLWMLGSSLMAFLIAASGGAVFTLLGTPLPWALGALTAAAIASIFYNRWPMPAPARTLARPVVGVLAGSAFTPDVVAQSVNWWNELLIVAFYTIAVSALGFFLIRRFGDRNPATAFFSAVPGGLGELSLLGDQYGGQARSIAFVHSVRIVSVVFVVPFLLMPETRANITSAPPPNFIDLSLLVAAGVGGYLLGRRGRFPGGELVASMLLSALIHGLGLTSAAPPPVVVILAQILIGAVTGSRFSGTTLQQLRQTGVLAVSWVAILLSSAILAAYLATSVSEMPFGALLLALAPGGTAEMIIIALSLGIDVAFVALCQICRIFMALAFAPIIFAMIDRNTSRERDP
jgi:uncharacterized protein